MALRLIPFVGGSLSSETEIGEVASSKKVSHTDMILFNAGTSATTVKVKLRKGSTDRQIWEREMASKETQPFEIRQMLAAGNSIKVDPGSGSIEYVITQLEDDA